MPRLPRWLQVAAPLMLIGPGAIIVYVVSTRPGTSNRVVWMVILASGLGVALLAVAQAARLFGPGPAPLPAPPAQRPRALILLGMLAPVAYLVMIGGITVTRHGSLLAGLLQALPMTAMFVGMGLIPLAFRRSGATRYCAACNYEQSTHAEADPEAHPRCPECGADWHRRNAVVIGERVVRRSVIALAVALAAFPFLTLAARPLGFNTANLHLKLLPTASLIKEVAGAPRGFVMDEWAALAKRTMTPAQTVRLADSLLDRRDRNGYIDTDSEKWLAAQALARAIPASTVDRLHSSAVTVWIDAPTHARVGEPISIGLGVTERGGMSTGFGTPVAHILFAGFDAADQRAVSRAKAAGMASGFGRLARHIATTTTTNKPSPTMTLAMPAPGPLRVAATYWLVFAPPGSLGPTIQWNEDGTPVLPAPVIWSERRAIDATIQIDP